MLECTHGDCPALVDQQEEIVLADLHGVVRFVNLLWNRRIVILKIPAQWDVYRVTYVTRKYTPQWFDWQRSTKKTASNHRRLFGRRVGLTAYPLGIIFVQNKSFTMLDFHFSLESGLWRAAAANRASLLSCFTKPYNMISPSSPLRPPPELYCSHSTRILEISFVTSYLYIWLKVYVRLSLLSWLSEDHLQFSLP